MAMAKTNSKAVDLALAHCEAWSNHDWDAVRESLADNEKCPPTSTVPGGPKPDPAGPEAYMQALRAFAGTVVPGPRKVDASVGDKRNALLQSPFHTDGPPLGPLTLQGARLYLFDEDDK